MAAVCPGIELWKQIITFVAACAQLVVKLPTIVVFLQECSRLPDSQLKQPSSWAMYAPSDRPVVEVDSRSPK